LQAWIPVNSRFGLGEGSDPSGRFIEVAVLAVVMDAVQHTAVRGFVVF